MTDRITQCDVVDCCEDCPRYADDCDGNKYLDRYPTMHEYAEGKRINPKLTDLISRADAIGIIEEYIGKDYMTPMSRLYSVRSELSALPSADAVHGEWTKTVDGNGWNEWYVLKCPFCDATIEDKLNRKWEYNFCPNCGAIMKGGAE